MLATSSDSKTLFSYFTASYSVLAFAVQVFGFVLVYFFVTK